MSIQANIPQKTIYSDIRKFYSKVDLIILINVFLLGCNQEYTLGIEPKEYLSNSPRQESKNTGLNSDSVVSHHKTYGDNSPIIGSVGRDVVFGYTDEQLKKTLMETFREFLDTQPKSPEAEHRALQDRASMDLDVEGAKELEQQINIAIDRQFHGRKLNQLNSSERLLLAADKARVAMLDIQQGFFLEAANNFRAAESLVPTSESRVRFQYSLGYAQSLFQGGRREEGLANFENAVKAYGKQFPSKWDLVDFKQGEAYGYWLSNLINLADLYNVELSRQFSRRKEDSSIKDSKLSELREKVRITVAQALKAIGPLREKSQEEMQKGEEGIDAEVGLKLISWVEGRSYFRLGTALLHSDSREDYVEGRQAYERSADLLSRSKPFDLSTIAGQAASVELAHTYKTLGDIYSGYTGLPYVQGKPPVEVYYEQALAEIETFPQPMRKAWQGSIMVSLAEAGLKSKSYSKSVATDLFRKGLQRLEDFHGETSDVVAGAKFRWASVLARNNDTKGAVEIIKDTLVSMKAVSDSKDNARNAILALLADLRTRGYTEEAQEIRISLFFQGVEISPIDVSNPIK